MVSTGCLVTVQENIGILSLLCSTRIVTMKINVSVIVLIIAIAVSMCKVSVNSYAGFHPFFCKSVGKVIHAVI